MQNIREYNRKIQSLRNTRKITGSMKMISSVKMQRFAVQRQATTPLWRNTQLLINRIGLVGADRETALPRGNRTTSHLILLITGDRGMCGAYNKVAVTKALGVRRLLINKGETADFACFGARGVAALRRADLEVINYYEDVVKNPTWDNLGPPTDDCLSSFLDGRYADVRVVYTNRVSALDESARCDVILPLTDDGRNKLHSETFEPHIEETVEELVEHATPILVRSRLLEIVLAAVFSEHSARVSAMDSATANCDRMIERYMQLRNRARQTAITTELSEIITGKEALEE